jgi:hypothetical protein
MTHTALRNNTRLDVAPSDLQDGDLVLSADGRSYHVSSFLESKPQPEQSARPPASDTLRVLGVVLLVLVVIFFLTAVGAALLAPRRNDEPLTQKDRKYIRLRDAETCFYCKIHAPKGHIDHRVSRANGGSNDYTNLAWACAPCNLSKGSRNDTEFLALFQ